MGPIGALVDALPQRRREAGVDLRPVHVGRPTSTGAGWWPPTGFPTTWWPGSVFTDVATGSMDAGRWRTTLEFLCAARGLPVPAPESVYRPQFLGAPAYSS